MFFKISYVVLLLATLLLGQVYIVGPITGRYVVVVLMFFICMAQKFSFPRNKYTSLYLVYIFIIFLTSIYHGYLEEFFKFFAGYFLPTLVFVWATYILVIKYKSPQLLLYTLLGFCLANAIVTILQYYMNPIGIGIAYALNVVSTDVGENILMKMEKGMTGFVMSGIVGAVPNGYFSAVGTVLALYGLYKRKYIFSLLSLVSWVVLLSGLFYVQERAGMIAGLFGSVLLFYLLFFYRLSTAQKIITLFVFLSVAIIYSGSIDLSNYIEGTRYESFDLDTRINLYEASRNYLSDNILVANMLDFYEKYKKYPHNLIYNAFIYGSFWGGIIMLYVIILMLKRTVSVLRMKTNDTNCHIVVYACAFLAYTLCSLTHNASILSGDSLGWLLVVPILIDEKDKRAYLYSSIRKR